MGQASSTTGRFWLADGRKVLEAGSWVSLVFGYSAPPGGLPVGSELRLGVPNASWSQPLPPHQRFWQWQDGDPKPHMDYFPRNTQIAVRTSGGGVVNGFSRMEQRRNERTSPQRWWMRMELARADLAEGDGIEILYGDTTWGEKGAQVQNFPGGPGDFQLWLRRAGQSEWVEVDGSPICFEVVPGPWRATLAVLPSIVRPDEPVTLRVAAHDASWNRPTSGLAGPITARLADGSAVGPLSQSLSSAGQQQLRLSLPAAEPRRPLRVQVSTRTGEARSNPAVVRANGLRIFWGDIHGKTDFSSDGHTPIDDYLAYARDVSLLDFTAVTDHSGCCGDSWITTQQKAAEFTQGGLVVLKGFEWSYRRGHRNIYFDNHRIEEPLQPSMLEDHRRFFGYLRGRRGELISIPHHTLVWMDWDVYDPVLEPVVEIYSEWGCSEYPGHPLWDKASWPGSGAQAAFARGYRMGIIASSDIHAGFPGRQVASRHGACFSYKGGLAAVFADELTPRAIWRGLETRRCYGTTGARILCHMTLNGEPMGSHLKLARAQPRRVQAEVVGTDAIRQVTVVRNNADWRAVGSTGDVVAIDLTDDEALAGPLWYYLRVQQYDNEWAWTSPVWVDVG